MTRTLHLLASALLALAASAPPLLAAEPPAADSLKLPGKPDEAWDAVFTRTSGWTGGDVAGTVDLGDGRILWLFGDTWIGSVKDGRHVAGAKMVNNSIAIQTEKAKTSDAQAKSGDAPAVDQLQFAWGHAAKDSGATAWITPDPGTFPKWSIPPDGSWYWPTGSGAVVKLGRFKKQLVIFLFHLAKQPNKPGIWGFQSLGSGMAAVDNFEQPPDRWRIKQQNIAYGIAEADAKDNKFLAETTWGVTSLVQPRESVYDEPTAYIYGVRKKSSAVRQLLLAKVSAPDLPSNSVWMFHSHSTDWQVDEYRLTDPIVDDIPSELSVEPLEPVGRKGFVMVYSEPLLGSRIFVRTAPRPEGPWSEPKAVYRAPEPDRDKSYFAYAAKGHLSLSRPGELLISYVVNSHDFNKMFNDASIYRPRFVRVKLDEILPKEKGN